MEKVQNDPEHLGNLYNMFLQKPQLKYTDDPELNLTIIALKKLINEYTKENQILKKLNLNYEQKELE